MKEYEKAERLFFEASLFCQTFQVYRDFAVLLKKQEKYSEALEMCLKALQINPDKKWLQVMRDSLLRRSK